MNLAAVSLAAAMALATAGPYLLRGVGRSAMLAPRAMLVVWTLATLAWLLTGVTFVLALVAEVMGPGLKGFVTACVTLVQAVHRNGAELGAPLVLAASIALGTRLLWVGLRRARQGRRWRREQHQNLATCATAESVHGHEVWLLRTGQPGAYCVPGRRFGIVVTQGAVDALNARELRAVLAHERAHLRGRHHLLIGWVALLNEAFPRVPLIRAAAAEVATLAEWASDDQAARVVGVAPLAHALGAIAAPGPAADAPSALAATGACTVQRVRRLLSAPVRPANMRRFLLTAAALVALLAPPVLLLASTVFSVAATHCSCAL